MKVCVPSHGLRDGRKAHRVVVSVGMSAVLLLLCVYTGTKGIDHIAAESYPLLIPYRGREREQGTELSDSEGSTHSHNVTPVKGEAAGPFQQE